MTYNFDLDRWYENQLRLLQRRSETGMFDEAGYDLEVEALDRRFDEMVRRLDGSYRIPGTNDSDS